MNIQIEGTYENQYSLSIVNKHIALSLAKHSDAEIKIYASTYHEKYMNLQSDIEEDIKPLVEKKLNNIDITIRNIYPPYTTAMKGYHKIFGPYGWEESKFPKEYVEWFNTKLTMIFTMSDYVKEVLENNGVVIPIVTTGLVVEKISKIDSEPIPYSLPSGFKLLHISSCFPRKGADILLEVFEKLELGDISLIIKTFQNPHNEICKQIEKEDYKIEKIYEENVCLYVKNKKKILLINKDISEAQIKYLYENSDLLVAPSLGEGFGLPMAEAMLLKLPVLTTAYGGQVDFCTDETSWLIDYDLVESSTHLNLENSFWAKPRKCSLEKQIIKIYNLSKDEIEKKLIVAQENILKNYSSLEVASKIINAIESFNSNKKF